MFRFIRFAAYIFGFYCIVFIPFPFAVFSFNGTVTKVVFGDAITFIFEAIFRSKSNSELSSDSAAMYLLILILFLISLISTALILIFRNKINFWPEAKVLITKALCYYLALQLLKYGFAKIFKGQFYLPEPNILYTSFGALDKDILFWSTMGTSRFYNLYLGFAEVIASLLLLFGRTRTVGLLVSAGIMLNVVVVNFSFDISVKIFSFFLLFISLLLLSPQLRSLWDFLILHKQTSLKKTALNVAYPVFQPLRISLKVFIICMLMTEVVYPFFIQDNYNDDNASRPFLHGAYEVTEGDISGMEPVFNLQIQRFFIHRDGYIIFQYHGGKMKDYRLITDSTNKKFTLTDYNLKQTIINYKLDMAGNPELHYLENGRSFILKSKSLNWRELPALKNCFHWTIEGL